MLKVFNDDISIVICGEAGQGVQTIEKLLVGVFKTARINVFATKEYMSRVRGGNNSTEIRVSSVKRRAYLSRIDLLVALDKDAVNHLASRITDKTVIIGDNGKLGLQREIIDVPLLKIAREERNPIYANTAAAGVVLGLFGIDQDRFSGYLTKLFASKGPDIVERNISAASKGFEIGRALVVEGKISIDVKANSAVKDEVVLSGAEAVALGAAAGGCDFVSAYPMTPSTGIFTFLARYGKELGIITEQAEDEISAVNMALGAWYAGARGFVMTAGGGFSLMVEALSLAGMMESPLVLSVGQRPAPATGLPTRTEQGDLEHVVYSGHGEFPRIVFSPGTVEEAFSMTQKAFNLADKYQVPVIILTDQYLADCYYNLPMPNHYSVEVEKGFKETGGDYKRYSFKLNKDGVSPRGVPGCGSGLVCADSDEHDENGHITEDLGIRKKMVEKRLGKMEFLKRGVMPPEFHGSGEYETLVIGWGSTFGVIKESLDAIGKKDVSFLHFKQVYPVHPFAVNYLKRAKKIIMVENNATSQFGKLLKLHTGFDTQHNILKYDGAPFSVEELTEELNKII